MCSSGSKGCIGTSCKTLLLNQTKLFILISERTITIITGRKRMKIQSIKCWKINFQTKDCRLFLAPNNYIYKSSSLHAQFYLSNALVLKQFLNFHFRKKWQKFLFSHDINWRKKKLGSIEKKKLLILLFDTFCSSSFLFLSMMWLYEISINKIGNFMLSNSTFVHPNWLFMFHKVGYFALICLKSLLIFWYSWIFSCDFFLVS